MKRKPKKPQARDEQGRLLKADGTLDGRARNGSEQPGMGRPRGEQPPVRIDYNVDEPGCPPKLRAFRYVCQYRRENEDGNEDSLVAATRKFRIDNPERFVDEYERLENEWKAQKGEASQGKIGETPLEIDRNSQKCLDAIEEFLKRLRAEALEASQREREAIRGEKVPN